MEITLCSTSTIKLGAVRDAAARVWTEPLNISLEGEARSGIPNQPLGDEETLLGALNRACSVPPRPDCYVVAIENGVARRGEAFADLAYVVVVDADFHVTVRSSRCVIVPPELVAQAVELGRGTTCGELEAARTPGADHTDPHVVWSKGATSRRALLADAVEEALRAACRSKFYTATSTAAQAVTP